MWPKRISEVTAADIEALIATSRQEGLRTEFKRSFSDGKPDSVKSKRAIAKELVAFANGQGGTLVMGIEEDKDRRASAIFPIEDCRTVADQLSASLLAIIDPPLPGFECEGIPTQPDGQGVVVLRVPASLSAPHWYRLGNDSEGYVCSVRRNTSSVPVSSMRDVHELVLAVETMRERLEARFDASLQRGTDVLYGRGGKPSQFRTLLLAIIAQPLSPIQLPEFLRSARDSQPETEFQLSAEYSDKKAVLPFSFVNPTPRLRGAQRLSRTNQGAVLMDDGDDGSVGTFLQVDPAPQMMGRPTSVYFDYRWALGALASSLVRANQARIAAGAPETEYELRTQLYVEKDTWIYKWGADGYGTDTQQITNLHVELPGYLVGSTAEFGSVEQQFNRDLQNALGRFLPSPLEIDWGTVSV